jgi:hypothetical protein
MKPIEGQGPPTMRRDVVDIIPPHSRSGLIAGAASRSSIVGLL